jgi:hypothetical protein
MNEELKNLGFSWVTLTERAVRTSRRNPRNRKEYRWVHVMHTFAVGSTVAKLLCKEFGLDPDELV